MDDTPFEMPAMERTPDPAEGWVGQALGVAAALLIVAAPAVLVWVLV